MNSKEIISRKGMGWRLRLMPTRAHLALVICMALALSAAPVFSQAQQPKDDSLAVAPPGMQEQDINSLFNAYELLDLDLKAAAQAVKTTGRFALTIRGSKYDLELEENNLLAPGFRATVTTDDGVIEEPPPQVSTYRGRVIGDEDSDVRLLIQEDMFFGYIRTRDDRIYIDPLKKYQPGARAEQLIAYRDADVRPESAGACGTAGLKRQVSRFFDLREGEPMPVAARLASLRVVEIATDADFEFSQANGNNTNVVIQGIINQVDGIYRTEVRLTFILTFQNVWTTTNAPYPYTSTNSGTLLTQLENEWNNNRGGVARDLVHLFTGKRLERTSNGRVVGRANIGVVCSDPSESYGLSSSRSSNLVLTVAHEIGHNFDAVHDSSSLCGGSGPIMCPSLQGSGSNTFSQQSKDDIVDHVNDDGDCLPAVGDAEFYTTDGSGNLALLGVPRNWRDTWHQIIPGDFNGDGHTDLLFYDRSRGHGEFYTSDGNGNIIPLPPQNSPNPFFIWRNTWDLIIPGNFDDDGGTDLLFYDRTNAQGEFYSTEVVGNTIRIIPLGPQYRWRESWDLIVPGNFDDDGLTDLLFYDSYPLYAGQKQGEFYRTDGQGNIQLLSEHTWRNTWDLIVPGNFDADGRTDLLFYDRYPLNGQLQGEFYRTDVEVVNNNNINITLSLMGEPHNWRNTWHLIIPGSFGGDARTDLLFYDRGAGQGEFYTTNGGYLTLLGQQRIWRDSWDLIVPGNFGRDSWADLLFYER